MGVPHGQKEPKATPRRPRSEGLALACRESQPLNPSSPNFQSLTRLKRLNLDGNSLSTVPALPASLQELKLNDNLLQGLQHSSFQGSDMPQGQGPKGPGLSSQEVLGKFWARGGYAKGSLAGGQGREHQPEKVALVSKKATAVSSRWAFRAR